MAIVNPNLTFLVKNHTQCAGIGLEGSSRSGKTWSSVDFIIWLAAQKEAKGTLNIYKETYNSFKTTLYDDFNRRLPMFGISSPFADKQEVRTFKLFDLKINLLGADSDTTIHGVGSDYNYFNEMLDIPHKVFDQAEMRCREFWWGDWNPKATNHWVFKNVFKRPDVKLLQTTFRDNPFISAKEKAKILSYEPTPENIANGTADEYMWNVYGLGLRSAPEGVIFQHVTYIKEFPENVDRTYYGSDIGYTNSPSTLVKVGVEGRNLYLKKMFYAPTESSKHYIELLRAIKFSKSKEIFIDSADPVFAGGIRNAGYTVVPVAKPEGSVRAGIGILKSYKIHIVEDADFMDEQQNYKYKEVHGIKLDEPEKGNDHLWDAVRYVALSMLRNR